MFIKGFKAALCSLFCKMAVVAFVVTSCKTAQIEGPQESYLPSGLSPAMSEFPLQVELDVKKLESAVNSKMNGLLYQGDNISGEDLSVKIWKGGQFMFFITNNEITYKVPLKIWCRFGWKMEKFGVTLSDHYEATGTISLVYKTTVNIDQNWNLVSKTISSGYNWLEKPKVKAVGVTIPVTPVVNLALSYFQGTISDQIDKVLYESVPLKSYVQTAWDEMQKPYLLSDSSNLWLKITPKELYMSPFTTTGNKLNLTVAFYAQLESLFGAQPAVTEKIPLPQLKTIQRQPQQFNINIAADVTFAKMAEMAKGQLLGKSFTEAGKTIKIDNLSIYSSAGRAVVVADVSGSYKGRVFFTGKPVYNPEKRTLEIAEPEFDIKTRNALLKSANWLMHGMILKKIAPMLTYPLDESLNMAKKEANDMIKSYEVYKGIHIAGALDSLSVTSVDMIPGAVRIGANVKGNVALKVDDLKF